MRPIDPSGSESALRSADIKAYATEVFENEQTAIDWLNRYNRELGAIPQTLLDTLDGTESVKRVLIRIDHGVVS